MSRAIHEPQVAAPFVLAGGARHPHGTRARYVSVRCRCEPCTIANREYARRRRAEVAEGDTRHLVPSDQARAHLRKLAREGVGLRSVSDASDVPRSILMGIKKGDRPRLRASTERRILAVDVSAVRDGARVDARPTRKLIRDMLRLGLTKGEIALRLGYSRPALQLTRSTVRADNALAVERLHREVLAEVELEKAMPAVCPECGHSHAKADRLRVLSRMRGAETDVIAEAWPCWYGGPKGRALLLTDLSRMRAAEREGAR